MVDYWVIRRERVDIAELYRLHGPRDSAPLSQKSQDDPDLLARTARRFEEPA